MTHRETKLVPDELRVEFFDTLSCCPSIEHTAPLERFVIWNYGRFATVIHSEYQGNIPAFAKTLHMYGTGLILFGKAGVKVITSDNPKDPYAYFT
jgi:hypothetical protein